MKILGLTGPSGAGKGEASVIFQRHGIPAIDTDAVYHELLKSSTALQSELIAAFGEGILTDGNIDRKKLGAAVFGHADTPKLLETLNGITHKYVMAAVWQRMPDLEKSGVPAVLIDAPQLFEAHWETKCDLIIGVLAEPSVRLARITARDRISAEAAEKRMKAQRSDDFYRQSCHIILENNSDLAHLERQIIAFLKTI